MISNDPTGKKLDVAIAGCGAISAVGRGVESLRAALLANSSGLRANERFANPRCQSNIVGAALVAQASSLQVPAASSRQDGDQECPPNRPTESYAEDDPAYALAEEALTEAHDQARDLLENISPDRIGLVLSTTKANIEALERLSDGLPCSASAKRHLQSDLLAADLAVEHGAHGPVQTVSVACVSGLIALMQGAKLIQRGAADAVFVVGVDHLSQFVVTGFTTLKAIDPNGCRPFDRDRCGLSPGEAGAAIVLVRGDLAQNLTVKIRGWGSTNDANHMTGPSRDGAGLAQAIRVALNTSGLAANAIGYVNVHGTGTPYNDAMESAALKAIFGDTCPPISGLKGMLGHTLGAAGLIETIACVLAMQNNFLPGTPRLNIPADFAPASIVKEPRSIAHLSHVLKLNTGFGGVNGALVLGHE